MKNIYSQIKPGFIVTEIYPVVAGYLQRRLEKIKNPPVKNFLDNQPSNVLDILRWEARKFCKVKPTEDPISRDYLKTTHPKIFMIVPKNFKGGRTNMTPIFYSCSKCKGRLFLGMPYCGWCGGSVIKGIKMEEGNPDVFFNFIDFVYPQSSKPSISPILSVLTKPDNAADSEESINPTELKQLLKDIDQFIPATAYVRD